MADLGEVVKNNMKKEEKKISSKCNVQSVKKQICIKFVAWFQNTLPNQAYLTVI